MTKVKYLFCINSDGEDFFTTSYSEYTLPISDDDGETGFNIDLIDIYNFNNEIDISNVKYVAIDDTMGISSNFILNKYENSSDIKFFEVKYLTYDMDRSVVMLEVLNSVELDYFQYKRESKINSILEIK